MRYLFAGGGTGGHIYPALSIAQALLEMDPSAEIVFVGSKRGLEKKIVPRHGFELKCLDIQAFQRKLSLDTLITLYKASMAVLSANKIITEFRPDVVIGTGGYVSGPPVFAAQLRKIPTVLQEQNALPGATTRILAKRADLVCVGYAVAKERLAAQVRRPDKVKDLGNPIRLNIMQTTRDEGYRILRLDPGKFTILVFGASQGSRAINKTMLALWPRLVGLTDWQVLWQTGENQYDLIRAELPPEFTEVEPQVIQYRNLQVRSYIHQMSAALAVSDLVIARAGAISLAEITAKGIPSILIPLPTAAENHQEHNARALERIGAAKVILEKDLHAESLWSQLINLINDEQQRQAMAEASRAVGKPLAATEIAQEIMRLAVKGRSGTH